MTTGSSLQTDGTRLLQTVVWIALGLAVVYGLWQAIAECWVTDDAFISFRYAWRLTEGQGLIYNIGERVEGYTNFLWTIITAGGMALGFEPIRFTQVISILSYLSTAGVLVALSRRIWRGQQVGRMFIPVAAMAILIQHDYHVWATSGMETAFVALLITLGFYLLVTGLSSRSILFAGVILVAGALTRPDAMSFYAVGAVFVLLARRSRWKSLLAYLLPLVVIYLPYWLWRYDYYGYPFPNTYYAKSAYDSYWSQGLFYIWLYFKTYYALLSSVLAASALFVLAARQWLSEKGLARIDLRIGLLGSLMAGAYLLYVARVGGDFMFARFLIPVTPLLLILIETALARWLNSPRIALTVALVFLALMIVRWNQFSAPEQFIEGIVEEKTFYPPEEIEEARHDGLILRKYFSDIDAPVGIMGARAVLAYYAQFPVAIECSAGLTDEHIAHQDLPERGRPGHEKQADYDYLRERGVRFMFFHAPPEYGRYGPVRKITFEGVVGGINSYDPELMNKLKQHPEVQFMDFLVVLDNYIANMKSIPPAQPIEDFNFFRQYYFDHVDDEPRMRQVVAGLAN